VDTIAEVGIVILGTDSHRDEVLARISSDRLGSTSS
jgi:hypothetical protein